MEPFQVVDLGSQAEAVARHVEGWTKSQFIAWLSCFGEVVPVPREYGEERYTFYSVSGRTSGFWFSAGPRLNLLLSWGSGVRHDIAIALRSAPE